MVLGGPGLAHVMDTLYLTAFHHEKVTVARTQALSLLPRALRNGDLHDFVFWLTQLIRGVKRNRMTEVLIIVETGEKDDALMTDCSTNL